MSDVPIFDPMELYVLKNKATGKWIALDQASGGYPYDVDELHQAELWHSRKRADRYNAVNSWEDYTNPLFEIHKLIMTTELVEQPTAEQLRGSRK